MKRFLTFAAGLLVAASLLAGEVTRVEPLTCSSLSRGPASVAIQFPLRAKDWISRESIPLTIRTSCLWMWR